MAAAGAAGEAGQQRPQHPAVFTHAIFSSDDSDCTGVSADMYGRVFVSLEGKGVLMKAPGGTGLSLVQLQPLDPVDFFSAAVSPDGTLYVRTKDRGIWRFHVPEAYTDGKQAWAAIVCVCVCLYVCVSTYVCEWSFMTGLRLQDRGLHV